MSDEMNPIQLEIYRNLFFSIAEEMGTVLRRTAYSPNIKERRDYSCAVFEESGAVVAMGDHMPVHLGSMPLSVAAAIDHEPLYPGDIVILNDPFSGGTHLPDITMVMPVYQPSAQSRKPLFYLASRAHHSDVGGMSPGSMPLSREIFQEGIVIPPLKLYREGRLNREILRLLLHNVRTPLEREGDLAAQAGALRVGEKRLLELVERRGRREVSEYVTHLQAYSERMVRQVIAGIKNGIYEAEDMLDDGGSGKSGSRPVKLRVAVTVGDDDLKVDFSGTESQVRGPLNAVRAIALSAVYYVVRCLTPPHVPSTAGLMKPVEVLSPSGTVVNAEFPCATAGGNVETSQRIVDVVLKALAQALPERIPAASSGTMNNLALGGIDPRNQQPFSYYETIAGGMGASPRGEGDSGVHTHMTNSLNTPVEALETAFPLRVREYRLRQGSGGRGQHLGGDGIVRSFEALSEIEVTVLSERRRFAPYGLSGGRAGKKGMNFAVLKGRRKKLPGKVSLRLAKGDVLTIETPGGGGWGSPRGRPSRGPQKPPAKARKGPSSRHKDNRGGSKEKGGKPAAKDAEKRPPSKKRGSEEKGASKRGTGRQSSQNNNRRGGGKGSSRPRQERKNNASRHQSRKDSSPGKAAQDSGSKPAADKKKSS
ncbi:MAG TPA: hydantoinase B/oxoprolinase family protein [Acidobacteriota bacterium]|nr:hydantoinase B/oxoprolinase family protein [Acidobacteriota bacterium]